MSCMCLFDSLPSLCVMSILSRASLFRYRLPLLALACVQAFLCSGIFYGWPALYALILEEGGMTHTCTRSSETKTMEENHACQTDKEKLNLVYTGNETHTHIHTRTRIDTSSSCINQIAEEIHNTYSNQLDRTRSMCHSVCQPCHLHGSGDSNTPSQ